MGVRIGADAQNQVKLSGLLTAGGITAPTVGQLPTFDRNGVFPIQSLQDLLAWQQQQGAVTAPITATQVVQLDAVSKAADAIGS